LKPLQLLGVEMDSTATTSAILALGALGAGVNFFSYAKLQLETAQIVGGIPKNSVVTEMDAQDGKNIFYLPPGVEYTAVMLSSAQSKEKAAINEQLILESVGKANGVLASSTTGGGIRGKLRTKTQDVKPKSQDVVLSVGAIGRRSGSSEQALAVNEAFRMLKPGGLFVFLEPGGEEVLELISKFFPLEIEEPVSGPDAGAAEGAGQRRKGKAAVTTAAAAAAAAAASEAQSLEANSPAAAAAAAESPGVPRLTRKRPGIVAAPISVPLRKFVSGIAVRP
jgi:SAM-dependent methyltransferase